MGFINYYQDFFTIVDTISILTKGKLKMKRILIIALLGIFITIAFAFWLSEKEFQPDPFDTRFIESFEKIFFKPIYRKFFFLAN